MLIYRFDENTKEYLGYREAFLDPLASAIEGKEIYAIPPFFTDITPINKVKGGFTQCFNEEKKVWEEVEDNRGLTVYDKKSGKPFIINNIGKIPSQYVKEKPVFIEELRARLKEELRIKYNKKYEEKVKVNKLTVGLEDCAELNKTLESLGSFNTVSYEKNDEVIFITKEELEKVIKYLYIRKMILALKKAEILKDINTLRSKKSLQEYKVSFESIEEDIEKLINLSLEEIDNYFKKVV